MIDTLRTTPRAARSPLLAAAALALSLPLVASAHGPTRQKVSEGIDVDAPAAEVWALIGDFDAAHEWLPMVTETRAEGGNEPDATRTLVLEGGAEVNEVLRRYDGEGMSYSYRIPDATHDVAVLPVNNYSSTLSVADNGEGSTVTWRGAFYRGYPNNDPPEELNDEAAAAAVTGLYRAGLQNIKSLVETP